MEGLVDRGLLEGTKFNVWQSPISVKIDGRNSGAYEAVVEVRARPSGDAAALPLKWTVRSEWIVTPKTLVIGAGEQQGRITVTPRRAAKHPMASLKKSDSLIVAVEAKNQGFELMVTRPAIPAKTLELFALKLGDETIPLSVMFVQADESVGRAKP